MREDPFAAILPVTWMNYSPAGFIPYPRTPTIAFLVQKSRLRFVTHAIRGRAVRKLQRNFLIRTGFVTAPEENPSHLKRAMSLMPNARIFFPFLSRDYLRHRLARRQLTNVFLS